MSKICSPVSTDFVLYTLNPSPLPPRSNTHCHESWENFLLIHFVKKDVVGITRHVVTTISAFSFTMLLLDRILTHIVNHISNTSYHLLYLYCQGGYVFGVKPNLITCVGYIFLSVNIEVLNTYNVCNWKRHKEPVSVVAFCIILPPADFAFLLKHKIFFKLGFQI